MANLKTRPLRPLHAIETDGVTVWVNGAGSCLGRFGRNGIDIHRALGEQQELGECLHCTHEETNAADWDIFVEKMKDHYNIKVASKYKPLRFR